MTKGFWGRAGITTFVFTLITCFTFSSFAPVDAYYYDNPDEVYYDLSRLVYKVTGNRINDANYVENSLDAYHPDGKFRVIDTIDVNGSYTHGISTTASGSCCSMMAQTGFKAMAVVAPGSHKLYIAFAGSQNTADYLTAKNIIESDIPGQLYQAQLYVNYIYKKFPDYQHYNYYFTGHSLG
jgi:hypothetical protein